MKTDMQAKRWREANLVQVFHATAPRSLSLTEFCRDLARSWNESVPVGTSVRYWPIACEETSRATKTRSEAWALGNGQVVVKIEGVAGGVAIEHLQAIVE
jgi:hypothetical protein